MFEVTGNAMLKELWEDLAVIPPKTEVNLKEVWNEDPWETIEEDRHPPQVRNKYRRIR